MDVYTKEELMIGRVAKESMVYSHTGVSITVCGVFRSSEHTLDRRQQSSLICRPLLLVLQPHQACRSAANVFSIKCLMGYSHTHTALEEGYVPHQVCQPGVWGNAPKWTVSENGWWGQRGLGHCTISLDDYMTTLAPNDILKIGLFLFTQASTSVTHSLTIFTTTSSVWIFITSCQPTAVINAHLLPLAVR